MIFNITKPPRCSSHRRFAPALALSSLAVVAGAACGSSDGSTPSAPPDAGSTDTSTHSDASATLPARDAAPPPAEDAGPVAAGWVGAPKVLAFSANGPDRLYGVTYGDGGAIFATGVIAERSDTAADVATVVAKLDATGALDTTFGTGGFTVQNLAAGTNGELARGIVVQSTGKVVVSATVEHTAKLGDGGAPNPRDRDVAFARFDASGKLDPTFGHGGLLVLDLGEGVTGAGGAYLVDSVWGLARVAGDGLVAMTGRAGAAGQNSEFVVTRLTADGAVDTTFGTQGFTAVAIAGRNASPRTLAVLDDGSIVGAGYSVATGTPNTPVVFKLKPDGALDATFGVNGVFSEVVLAAQTETYAAVAQGSALVTTGYGKASAGNKTDFLSIRLTASGARDPSYGTNGALSIDVGGFDDNSRSVVALPDGRVVFAGGGRPVADDVDGVVAVATRDGKPDTTFAPRGFRLYDLGGPADFLWSVALSPSKKSLAFVGVKGAVAAAADAGPATDSDDSVVMVLPVGP